ncbi:FAD-dependent oxidoreductase [Promicromonospora sp. CA-289599]|uniref:FAD-dependent oxidoreductase n=1 Tax=Promicromonospora sp. CA-289599 TaxID=3240014 RepID=UPI003D91A4D2
MKVVIVGGVAGGMSAATRLRRLVPDAEIIVLERGEHVSFANCGLPYYIGGTIEHRSALLLQTPESLRDRFALDVRVRHEVLAIDRAAQTVEVRDHRAGVDYTQEWDHLVLSTGAAPVVPSVPGVERALTLRDVADADVIAEAAARSRTAVVAGAGFIGLEMAENLHTRGLSVALVELSGQVLPPLDPEMAQPVLDHLRAQGVSVHLGSRIQRIDATTVVLDDGSILPADLVIMAIGVRPDSRLAAAAGLSTSPGGGVVVDASLRTSDPRIHAVGDLVQKTDAVSGKAGLIPLAGPANRQGRLAADAIAGRAGHDESSQGTAVIGVLGLTAAVTGWNEKRLRAAGRPHRIVHIHPLAHAGYYPGATPLSIKLLIDARTDQILGAQAVGTEGVDKRIDVLATAMAARMRASDLLRLELAYAPQYGTAKDPVNMLGYLAENLANGTTANIQWHEVEAARAAGATVVDVRTAAEFAAEAIPGAINLPLDELRYRLGELPPGRLIVHCQVGQRAHSAVCLLRARGRDAVNLDGGLLTWRAGNLARGEL